MIRWIIVVGILARFIGAVGLVGAETAGDSVPAGRHRAGDYTAGDSLEVCVEIESNGALMALGYRVVLPDRWSFLAVSGSRAPSVTPSTGETGTINFAWITPPGGVVDFSFTVEVPGDCDGIRSLEGVVLFRIGSGEEEQAAAQPDPLVVYRKASCDLDGDGDTDLADAILGLGVLCGLPLSVPSNGGCLSMGLGDVSYVLQRLSASGT